MLSAPPPCNKNVAIDNKRGSTFTFPLWDTGRWRIGCRWMLSMLGGAGCGPVCRTAEDEVMYSSSEQSNYHSEHCRGHDVVAHYLCNTLYFDMQIVSNNIAQTFRHLYDNIFSYSTAPTTRRRRWQSCNEATRAIRCRLNSVQEMDGKIGNLAGTMPALISFKSFPVLRTLTGARVFGGGRKLFKIGGFIHLRETCKQDATTVCLQSALVWNGTQRGGGGDCNFCQPQSFHSSSPFNLVWVRDPSNLRC